MQNPTSEEGALIKREWWRPWKYESLPALEFIIQSYDTAFSKKDSADFSAITTWGVFRPSEDSPPCLMLIDSLKGRWDFPELKAVAMDQYSYWNPESVVIEAKASGMPLIQELRRTGIPVHEFVPGRGKDKVSRVNACSPVFASGMVWYPEGKQFAHEVIEECAAFPNGEHDDLVDSTTQAVLRYREGNFVSADYDYELHDEPKLPQEHKYYDC
jgi:predicted phage terminase large subunit-like protein